MIIAIANYKGGVGKTTTAINVAYNLAAIHEKRVLMIDADSSRNLSIFFRTYDEKRAGLTELIRGECSFHKAVKRSRYKNLDIIQSKKSLIDINEDDMDGLYDVLPEIRERYDHCIIDCHPDFNHITKGVLAVCDHVIVPIKVDRNALNGLELMQECLDEMNRYRAAMYELDPLELKVLITMYQNNKVTRSGIEELITKTNYPVFHSVIRNTCKCVESIEKKKPLMKCASKSTACQDYDGLVYEILGGGL